jgi:glycosyltransferase involved in cell wall biosynthesis
LIGKIGYGGKNLLKELTTRENVVYLGNVQDELLKKIYNISSVFLFPSLYEGFGFPPLEAMNCGLPVLSSNNTALKEVIGSGGVLHAPDDYNSFVQDIFKLIGDKNFHREVSNSGIERAKIFNINRTAKELVNIFNEL